VSGLKIPGARVLEIGSRDINGAVRGLFRDCAEYVGVDVNPGPGVDVVGDFCELYSADSNAATFDIVVCTEVLEHYKYPSNLIYHAHYLLKPNGAFIVTCASEVRPPHSAQGEAWELQPGEYYGGITLEWMEKALSKFATSRATSQRFDLDIYGFAQK
jgi:SAM-dependent methyltransferase